MAYGMTKADVLKLYHARLITEDEKIEYLRVITFLEEHPEYQTS